MATAMEVRGLTKRYARITVLDDVSFRTRPGRALALRGGNGSGKTTLLRCLNGTLRPDGGQVLIDDQPYDPGSPGDPASVYGVLDDFAWFPELTVGDHLALLDPRCDPPAVLRRLGAGDLADRTAASLSSGQRRRSALATVLVRPLRVLLLDEPEQRLDDDGLALVARELGAFLAAGRCVVLATHSDRLRAALDADELRIG
ncbi:MAG TPA: ATP-binding cassette domain-containing protein [Cellulomonas sp.]